MVRAILLIEILSYNSVTILVPEGGHDGWCNI